MTARRPPSLRDPNNYGQRLANGLRAMSKGSDGGRVLNASPIRLADAADAPDLDLSPAGGAASEVAFLRDRFPTSGTLSGAASTLALTATPASSSLHLYLNGLELDEGTDYTLSGSTVTVLTPAGTGAGDILEARYAYDGITAAGTITAGLTDTFTRANSGTLGTAESGQTWWSSGSVGIVSNKAKFSSGTNAVALADTGVMDGTFEVTIVAGTGTIDAALVFRADSNGSNFWFAQLYSSTSPGLRLAKTGGSSTGEVLDGTLAITAGTSYTITVILSGASVTVKVNGTTRITYTMSGADLAAFTGTYAGLRMASSDTTSTYDNISVIP